jgi:hypothetical protein
LSVVNGLTSISLLYKYTQRFKYVSDKGDYWQIPVETLERGRFDCEDIARFALDALARIQRKVGARFVIHFGYNKKRWENKLFDW